MAASASVEGAQLGSGATAISVGAVRSTQVASCAEGKTVASGSSAVEALVVGGTPVPIVDDRPVDLSLGPVRVRANQLDGATRRGLVVDYADGRQLVLGEATADGDACAAGSQTGGQGGAGGPGTGSSSARVCAEGAEYDVESNTCVIREDADGGADGKRETIVIGHPYEGQRGGSVLSLDEARQRVAQGTLGDSPCLRGKGPEFVVLGSRGRDVITGANTADRILSLAGDDRVSGGVGDDCIDGGRGADRLTGDNGDDVIHGRSGNDQLGGSADADKLYAGTGRDVVQGGDGKDRVSGGSGRDAVNGGSGTDKLLGGSGNDSLNTGFGRDSVHSGSGRDSINASTAGPASRRIRCGKGRDTLRINRNERRRTRGCETVYSIR
jgi:Ca2+-binding RTX toxin-like protein